MSDTNPRRASGADQASGRFVLRLPPGLHAALREAARESGQSLNDYCLRRLSALASRSGLDALSPTIERAAEVAGASLVGVVAFGSWARGCAAATSDIDVLIVVEPDFALTRAVYRCWDERPLVIDGRPVESHVVRLPNPGSPVTAVWAEVAIDGIVLFEQGLRVSTYLGDVRKAIANGRLTRRVVHGQPYWHEDAETAQHGAPACAIAT